MSTHDSHHGDPSSHAHPFDPEPTNTLSEGEPHTPVWLPMVGLVLAAAFGFWAVAQQEPTPPSDASAGVAVDKVEADDEEGAEEEEEDVAEIAPAQPARAALPPRPAPGQPPVAQGPEADAMRNHLKKLSPEQIEIMTNKLKAHRAQKAPEPPKP